MCIPAPRWHSLLEFALFGRVRSSLHVSNFFQAENSIGLFMYVDFALYKFEDQCSQALKETQSMEGL